MPNQTLPASTDRTQTFQGVLTSSLEELMQTFPAEGKAFVQDLAVQLDSFVAEALATGMTDTTFLLNHARARFDQLAAIHLAQLRDRLKEKTREVWLAVVRTAIAVLVPSVPAAGTLAGVAGEMIAPASSGAPSWLKQG